MLEDVLSDRERLVPACRDDPPQLSDETRLGVAEACFGIAEGLLPSLLDDTSTKQEAPGPQTRSAVAADNAPRALEWVRHALHLGHGVAEKPFLESAAFLEAWALEKMGYLGVRSGLVRRPASNS